MTENDALRVMGCETFRYRDTPGVKKLSNRIINAIMLSGFSEANIRSFDYDDINSTKAVVMEYRLSEFVEQISVFESILECLKSKKEALNTLLALGYELED